MDSEKKYTPALGAFGLNRRIRRVLPFRSKRMPHQGKKECERRRRQEAKRLAKQVA